MPDSRPSLPLFPPRLSDVDTCLEAPTWGSDQTALYGCHGKRGNQEWQMDASGVVHHEKRCLAETADRNAVHLTDKCDESDPFQQWEFISKLSGHESL